MLIVRSSVNNSTALWCTRLHLPDPLSCFSKQAAKTTHSPPWAAAKAASIESRTWRGPVLCQNQDINQSKWSTTQDYNSIHQPMNAPCASADPGVSKDVPNSEGSLSETMFNQCSRSGVLGTLVPLADKENKPNITENIVRIGWWKFKEECWQDESRHQKRVWTRPLHGTETSALQRFIDSFSAEAESLRLGNLLACLFWLGLSAEAWTWSWAVLAWSFSSLWWRKDEKPTKLQGFSFLSFLFVVVGGPGWKNSLFWNFFSRFQMWLKQNQLPVCWV